MRAMSENRKTISFISVKDSDEVTHKDVAVSTESSSLDNGQPSTRTTTENDIRMVSKQDDTEVLEYKEPNFYVLVDSSNVSNPSSQELLIEKNLVIEQDFKKLNMNGQPIDMPSTSRDSRSNILPFKQSDCNDEMQMIAINLQSENEIQIADDTENDEDSIVIAYLRNKKIRLGLQEISETSLDVRIPSFPGSPRSFSLKSETSLLSIEEEIGELRNVVEYLHENNPFLEAAEVGDDKRLEFLLSKPKTDIQQLDHLGRSALHLAVCSGNERAIRLLLDAGIKVNVKDNVGMSPLSLCLMRNQSLRVANLLFDHGAVILPRSCVADTGLFLQFVMMCIPTEEDKEILELLVRKGALVNDPAAPGGRQALHIAAMSNNCDLITKLVSLGAKLHVKNHRNETPKEFAMIFRCKDAIALLEWLESQASSCTSESGDTDSDALSPTESTKLSTDYDDGHIAHRVTITETKTT